MHQGAQVQRVGPALHEGRPVRGVLHAVGEDERLLLVRGDVRAAEQLPSVVEASVATREPRKRMPSGRPHDGHCSSFAAFGVRSDDDGDVARQTGRSGRGRRRGLRVDPHARPVEPSAASPGAWIQARDTDWSVAVLLQTATGA